MDAQRTATAKLLHASTEFEDGGLSFYFAHHQVFLFNLDIKQIRRVTWAERATKRVLDVLGALIGLVCFSPIMLIAAILIRLDDGGPILFAQSRTGLHGKVFTMYKFRTMTKGEVHQQVSQGDTRISRAGFLLRRTSIDEFPQLFNVLFGDMSLVGPRPHPVWLDRQLGHEVVGYWTRYTVKPGITGLAQISRARGPVNTKTMARRLDLDLLYIRRWSLLQDIAILYRTVLCIWTDRAAY